VGKNPFWLAVFANHTNPLSYLRGPFLFFYIRGMLYDQTTLKKKDWLHFIPFFINLISITPYTLKSFDYKFKFAESLIVNPAISKTSAIGLYPTVIDTVARPMFSFAYVLFCLIMLLRFSFKANKIRIPNKLSPSVTKWLYFFIIAILVQYSFFVVNYYFYLIGREAVVTKLYSSSIMIFMNICLLLIPLSLLIFPEILYGIPRVRINQKDSFVPYENRVAENSTLLENKEETLLTAGEVEEIEPYFIELSHSILSHLEETKLYLQPDFSLDQLAKSMSTPKHHLYYCFNNVLYKKFTKVRSELRVNYAKKLLEKGLSDSLTLDAIGNQSGFLSRSSFYNTFKDEVGCSPGEYLKEEEGT
jgi:AraC-like DNA-binding protein